MRNFVARKAEHENPLHNSQPARHLSSHPSSSYTWNILHKEKSLFKRKIIEGLKLYVNNPALTIKYNILSPACIPRGLGKPTT